MPASPARSLRKTSRKLRTSQLRHTRNRKMLFESLEDRSLLASFAVGSIQGQDGWSGGVGAISTAVDQTVDQSGANAHTGIGSWRISNNTSLGNHNGAFGAWPYSPPLNVAAGQPSSGAGADRFEASFYFRTASGAADGTNIEIDLGTTAGDDRNTFLAITNRADADGGLQLRMAEPNPADAGNDYFYPTQIVMTGVSRGVWHRIDISAQFVDGASNDAFQVLLDGVAINNPTPGSPNQGTPDWGTFEGYRDGHGFAYAQSNRLLFRSGAAPSAYGAFSDTDAQGLFIDDVNYSNSSSSNPGTTLAYYSAAFETQPSITYVDDNWIGTPANTPIPDADLQTPGNQPAIFGVDAFAALQDGISAVGAGGTVIVNAGTYITVGEIELNQPVTIDGAGQDATILKRAGQATGTEDRAVEINAPNVTISNLTLGGWQDAPSAANLGKGYLAWTNADFTTFDNVRFDANDNRVALYMGTHDNLTVANSRFTGTLFRAGIRGAGEFMNIHHNSFEESHYWYSPIYMEYGSATSGTINHNYFANRVGVANDALGDFKEDGTGLYAITNYQPNATTADGLVIEYNTFDFQDSDLVNGSGAQPIATGVYIDPLLSPSGPITIKDNIFQGYQYTGAPASNVPLWQPGQGVFGGALEFDGVDDFGVFQSPLFDVGTQGTLSFWVKMDDTGKRNQFFEGPGDGGFEFQYRTNSSGQFYGRTTTVGGDFVIRSGGDSSAQGVWTNLQFTWDFNASNPTGKMHIYRDGVESGYLAGFTPNDLTWASVVSTVNGLMNVGRDPSDPTRLFDGMMDDIAWFNAVLPSGDLTTVRTSGAAALAADPRLVAHWDLDSAAGNTEIDNKNGIVLHLSSDGSLPAQFGPQFVAGGQFGGALDFDGFDDYATFNFGNNELGDKGTLNFWVQMDDVGKRNQFFEGPGNGGLEVQYRTNSGGQFYSRGTDGNGNVIRSGPDGAASLGVWRNIQVTWDIAGLPPADGGGKMRIYVDGVESGYLAGFDPNSIAWNSIGTTINGLMSVGRDPGDASRFFNGRMDDIAWFNDVLPAADRNAIRAGSAQALAGDPRLTAYWNLDNPIGTSIVAGNGGTSIDLFLQAPVPPAPLTAYAINASPTVLVQNNLFWNNQVNFNPEVTDGGNLIGDPLFAGISNGPATHERYALQFGSPAAFNGSGYPAVDQIHIGAFQGIPLLPAAVIYVNDDWAALPDDTFIPDAEPNTPGNQPVFIGTNGYSDIDAALAAVAPGGTIVVFGSGAGGAVNADYSAFTVTQPVSFRLLQDPVNGETVATLNGAISLDGQHFTIQLDQGHGLIDLATTALGTIDAISGTPSVSITTSLANQGSAHLAGAIGSVGNVAFLAITTLDSASLAEVTTNIGGITVSVAGALNLSGDLSTVGTPTIGSPVTLTGSVAVTSAVSITTDGTLADSNVQINGSVDGPGSLQITTGSADTTITGVTGGVSPLASLAITSSDISLGNIGVGPATAGVTGATSLTATTFGLDIGSIALTGTDYIGGSAVTLTVNDSAAAGEDLNIASGITIRATTGSLTLNAGDNSTLAAGATLNAATTINVNVDASGAADPAGGIFDSDATIVAGGAVTFSGASNNDLFRLRSLTAGLTSVSILGLAGDDQFQLYDVANSASNIASPITNLDGGPVGGNDSLTLIDSGDSATIAPVLISITGTTIDGLTNTAGTDVTYANINVLDVTTTSVANTIALGGPAAVGDPIPVQAYDDDITIDFSAGVGDLSAVTVNGSLGNDRFVVKDFAGQNGLLDLNLNGDEGKDTFGAMPVLVAPYLPTAEFPAVQADALKPHPTTRININGGFHVLAGRDDVTEVAPSFNKQNGNDYSLDTLNLDMTQVSTSAVAIIDTLGGTAITLGLAPVTFSHIEAINLADQGKMTNTQLGDLYVRGTANNDNIQVGRAPNAANPNRITLRIQSPGQNFADYFTQPVRFVVYGGAGNDNISMGNLLAPSFADFHGEEGNDMLTGSNGDDLLVGGLGSDRINANGGNNEVWGDEFGLPDAEAPEVSPGVFDLGKDIISTGNENDIIYGGWGDDSLTATGGNDFISGGTGNDTLSGGEGDDRLFGGTGNDSLFGANGNDILSGGVGNDILQAGNGNDVLFGGDGADTISGEAGLDLLITDLVNSVTNSEGASDDTVNTAGSTEDLVLMMFLSNWANSQTIDPVVSADDGDQDIFYSGSGQDRVRISPTDRNGETNLLGIISGDDLAF